jgi:hypothetical protein
MRKIAITACAGFTTSIITLTLLSKLSFMPEINSKIVLEIFVIAVSIALLMFVYKKIEERFNNNSLVVDALIRVLICYIAVVIEGCLFGMIPFGWIALGYASIVIIPAFIVAYAIIRFTVTEYANEINDSIKRKQKTKDSKKHK